MILIPRVGLRRRTPSPQRGEGWGKGAPTERPARHWLYEEGGEVRLFPRVGLRTRAPSPQRGEGWGEGALTARPYPLTPPSPRWGEELRMDDLRTA